LIWIFRITTSVTKKLLPLNISVSQSIFCLEWVIGLQPTWKVTKSLWHLLRIRLLMFIVLIQSCLVPWGLGKCNCYPEYKYCHPVLFIEFELLCLMILTAYTVSTVDDFKISYTFLQYIFIHLSSTMLDGFDMLVCAMWLQLNWLPDSY